MSTPLLYHVALQHLNPEASEASPDFDPCDLGRLSDDALLALLQRFSQLDPVQNAYADPEIRIERRGERHVVRTGQGKLILYDARDRAAPGQVVTPAQLMAELDGSAKAARTTVPFIQPAATEEVSTYVPPPAPPRRPYRLLLSLATAVLLLASFVVVWTGPGDSPFEQGERPRPMETDQAATTDAALVGVFMSGSEPGRHGIALSTDGAVKLFRVNKVAAPSVRRDTYRPGWRDKKLVLTVERLGTEIESIDADTLAYCGETYRRIP